MYMYTHTHTHTHTHTYVYISQWPRGLRRRSAAARFFSVVNVVYCQVEVTERSPSLVQRIPIECGASLCV